MIYDSGNYHNKKLLKGGGEGGWEYVQCSAMKTLTGAFISAVCQVYLCFHLPLEKNSKKTD